MLFVTGATGFVGQNLMEKLVNEKIKTRCLVRDKSKISESNKVEIIQGDISDKAILYKATQNVETVIHLAAVIKSSSADEFIKVNVEGTRNLIEACIKSRVRRIIYVSSLDATLSRTNIYGKTKAMGEDVIRNSGLDYIILRPALIYGKGSKDIGMLSKFIKKYPFIPVVGSGEGRLQPVYIDDICNIIIKLIKSDIRNKTYSIAGEQKITLNGLIDKIAENFSKKVINIRIPLWLLWLPLKLYGIVITNSHINYESLSLLEQDKICDIDEIKKDFNFKPVSLDDGLKLVLQN